MSMQSPFGVRITLTDKYGHTHTREYLRTVGNKMGRAKFSEWALGNLLILVGVPIVDWEMVELSRDEIFEAERERREKSPNSAPWMND